MIYLYLYLYIYIYLYTHTHRHTQTHAHTHTHTHTHTQTHTRSYFLFLGLHPWHMEAPRLGVQSEPSPPAYTRASTTRDPSPVCDLHQSSRQHPILNPTSEARDRTRTLRPPSRIRPAMTGTPTYVYSMHIVYLFLMPTPQPYGSSQTHGRIRAVAAGLPHSHSNAGSLTHQARPGEGSNPHPHGS